MQTVNTDMIKYINVFRQDRYSLQAQIFPGRLIFTYDSFRRWLALSDIPHELKTKRLTKIFSRFLKE